jgi:hypothetical protein
MVLSGAVAVVGMAEEQCVDITDPPMLGWEVRTGDRGEAARQGPMPATQAQRV